MRSINERLSVVTVLVILMLFTTVLAYWIIANPFYTTDWKKGSRFRLAVGSCKQAEAKAEEDFKRGIVRMYFTSGLEEDTTSFPLNFYKQLEEKYNIEVILAGDVGYPYYSCYNLRVDKLLSQKIGESRIEKLYQKMHEEKYGQ